MIGFVRCISCWSPKVLIDGSLSLVRLLNQGCRTRRTETKVCKLRQHHPQTRFGMRLPNPKSPSWFPRCGFCLVESSFLRFDFQVYWIIVEFDSIDSII